MGLLADIYISSDDDGVKYDTSPNQFLERAQFKGIMPLELSILWSLMRGVEFDIALLDEFPRLLQSSEGGRYIHRFPPTMVTELSALSFDRVASLASAWVAAAKLNCSPEEVRPVVYDLIRLSRLAIERRCSVHIWNCI